MTMGKRCLAMVVYDPAAAAAAAQESAAKRPRRSADASAVVPCDADAQPINAVPWTKPQKAPPLPVFKKEPPCLRSHLLPALRLRADLQVHFIDVKTVTSTDLDAHQNRFRIPTDGVLRRLRLVLTPEELASANLLYEPEPRRRPPKQLPEPENSAAGKEDEQVEQSTVKKKRKGRKHGGLPVRLVDLAAGGSWELRLSRWESSHGTIVKGEGYLDFIRRCSFKEKDVVEIWAFKQRQFRNFGVTMCEDSILHIFIVKRENRPEICRYCPLL